MVDILMVYVQHTYPVNPCPTLNMTTSHYDLIFLLVKEVHIFCLTLMADVWLL